MEKSRNDILTPNGVRPFAISHLQQQRRALFLYPVGVMMFAAGPALTDLFVCLSLPPPPPPPPQLFVCLHAAERHIARFLAREHHRMAATSENRPLPSRLP